MPKGSTTSKGFIISLINIFKDSELKKKEIINHDYKTQTIIKIAKEYNIKKIFNWISYEEFYIKKKEIIDILDKDINNEDNISQIIYDINIIEDDINIEDKNEMDENESEIDNNIDYSDYDEDNKKFEMENFIINNENLKIENNNI